MKNRRNVNEAFATLSDPVRRTEYDQRLEPVEGLRHPEPPAGASSVSTVTPAPVVTTVPARPAAVQLPEALACSFCSAPCSRTQVDWIDGVCASCGSPLYPAAKHRDGEDWGRAIARAPRHMPMAFWMASSGTQRHSGTTDDLSLNGMRFISTTQVLVGVRLRIECDFCTAVAVVRRAVRDSGHPSAGWRCGVEFLTLRFSHEQGSMLSTSA